MSRTTTRLARVALAIGVALALVAATGGVAAGHSGDDGMHHHDGWMGSHAGGGMWGGFGWLWMLGGLLVVFGVPAIALYALTTRDSGSGGAEGDDALTTLRRRYAAGEIDEEEFERREGDLRETSDWASGERSDP
ncbi:putative membrane protein [Halorientalis persicus]|uniref:Putative membrane protein n=1 Tax=Halorientalis persicus TaxID=1367881 RepID=A0A1H8DHK1_9EURY|nr:SHOCT domain-containing protein [Halorientalis persicus]SEN06812.1 putative membrane protein [Halorientalis persicus]